MVDKLRFILIYILLFGSACNNEPDIAGFVNPFIGASTSIEAAGTYHGLGKTFPGAATPFGMVQVSPNTITGGDNGSGYSYEHQSIEGFALTQMSGVGWYGDLGNFLVTPTTGPMKTNAGNLSNPNEGYRSKYLKETEKTSAGYYAVELGDYQVKAEMTATPHCGMFRFTFPENNDSRIQIDLARRVGGTSTLQHVELVDVNSISGWMECPPEGGGWGNGDGKADYTVYFYASFSKPLFDYGIWSADIPENWARKRENVESEEYQKRIAEAVVHSGLNKMTGRHLGFYSDFETQENDTVLLKVGISFVSVEGAKKNLKEEIKEWDFNTIHRKAARSWNEALGKIIVQGGTNDEKHTFYTALYHSMIDPRICADIDGNYRGGDGEIHQTETFAKRTIFSGWDVFRSQFPLQTLINPEVVNDMINSLVELADENGTNYLERWELLNAYSGCMVGNPAISVIWDAYEKGIRGFNTDIAYRFARNTSELFGNGEQGYSSGNYSISNTLEYAYTEWCMSEFARELGYQDDVEIYKKRSEGYRSIFDPEVAWFRPKNEDGSWQEWPKEGRLKQDYGCIESNPYQQGWFVPHDVSGLADLMGGNEKTVADLESFFEHVPEDMSWNNYYNHANEPVHHIPYLFNRLGAPWLTQKWTREICKRAYHNSVEGLVGNEDVGQMSAWYVLASVGLAQVCPGDMRYEITSPVFSRINIRLKEGKKLTIVAHNNSSENIYIQEATWNGEVLNACYLDYKQIISGGELVLDMGSNPNYNWGLEKREF